MNLSHMIDERLISFGLDADTKDDAINKVVKMLYQADKISDPILFHEGILQREEEFSTGIGNGIAIPHCMSHVVKEATFTLVKLKHDIEWKSLDDKPVNYIIMLAAPKDGGNMHLKMLSQLAMNLMDDAFRKGLLNASSIEDIKETFKMEGE